VGLGICVSSRARREFDNLIDAFARVSGGDLSTAVMSYTEGEFAHLADSFSEMTQKLKRSQTQLATAERIAAWQAMARKIAHEIKNPLTPIGISADDLRRSYQENLPGFADTLDRNTRTIRSEVNRLTRLLDEFVSFARMRPPDVRNVDVADALNRVKTLYAEAVTTERLKIDTKTRRRLIRIDDEMLQQLLVNLIKNGLEASSGGTVTVTLEDDANDLVLSVSDNGPGFADKILANQFQPYLSTKKEGSGLGLVICQRIAHDHGGQIELANNKNGGAKVTVSLPQA
jgi:nitrogen fixation/metabolism regulation signal transduction histidine kinase